MGCWHQVVVVVDCWCKNSVVVDVVVVVDIDFHYYCSQLFVVVVVVVVDAKTTQKNHVPHLHQAKNEVKEEIVFSSWKQK